MKEEMVKKAPRVGIWGIPDGEIYNLGSAIIGYDVKGKNYYPSTRN